MIYLALTLLGTAIFTLSTLTAGGGAMMLLPILHFTIGTQATAPVLNFGNFLGRPVRLFLFWKHIDWSLNLVYIPAASLGAVLGAYLFAQLDVPILQLLVGIFLVTTGLQFRFGKKERIFKMQRWQFIPVGFVVAFISSLIGSTGPVLNPFYLNYGLEKEALIATKTANSFFVGILQVGTYVFFDALHGEMWKYGICLGIGISLGSYIGKRLLKRISAKQFRQYVVYMMVISGLVILGRYFFFNSIKNYYF